MTHKSTTKSSSRRYKWLRYFLRKRPCFYLSLCEAATFTFLSIIAFLSVYFYIEIRDIRFKYDSEDAYLKTLSNYKTFAHCFYKPLKNSDFHISSCSENSRNQSFAWRHHELMHQNEPTCVDKHEQIKCHEHISQQNFNVESYSNFTACSGVEQISMGNRFLSSPPSIVIKHPRIPNLSTYLMKTLHSSELFVKCPKCKKTTTPFKWNTDSKCFIKLSTIDYGWPSKMYECDNMQVVPDSECDNNDIIPFIASLFLPY